jgi:hypothetical protein
MVALEANIGTNVKIAVGANIHLVEQWAFAKNIEARNKTPRLHSVE